MRMERAAAVAGAAGMGIAAAAAGRIAAGLGKAGLSGAGEGEWKALWIGLAGPRLAASRMRLPPFPFSSRRTGAAGLFGRPAFPSGVILL